VILSVWVFRLSFFVGSLFPGQLLVQG
jgi:hypothetical protein